MRICYIILTCEKYLDTRCNWVEDTWLKRIEPDDSYYFLSSIPNEERRILGWKTRDDYMGCSTKYYEFFKNHTVDADWIVLVDDDTFVFPEKMRRMLQAYTSTTELVIGKIIPPYISMSGGAGVVLSSALYTRVCAHVRSTQGPDEPLQNSDVQLFNWLRVMGHSTFVWDRRFHANCHREDQDIHDAITFHYVTTRDWFEFYNQLGRSPRLTWDAGCEPCTQRRSPS